MEARAPRRSQVAATIGERLHYQKAVFCAVITGD
jgi:hypothetical protein